MKAKDIQRLWERCGLCAHDWKRVTPNFECTKCHEKIPTASTIKAFLPEGVPDLTLDNLFKYAVPKLGAKNFALNCKDDEWRWTFLYPSKRSHYGVLNYYGYGKDPAEALAQAILKVVDGGG